MTGGSSRLPETGAKSPVRGGSVPGEHLGRGGRYRIRVRVRGVVQGVGFRPYVYRAARDRGLGGWVRNDASGVLVEVEGRISALRDFVERLAPDAPLLAAVDSVDAGWVEPRGEVAFRIVESDGAGGARTLVSPDTATCADCLRELVDPADRRFRYPFVNCTNCGPRFTIVRGVPYDRPLTTMAGFEMCEACRREYEDPGDRRFHAQPNACPECGPRVRLLDSDGRAVGAGRQRDAVEAAAASIRDGAIAAVKGLGGFHLACRADDAAAVARLRERKRRPHKPFAVMAGDLSGARRLVRLAPEEEAILTAIQRPIVLARRRADAPVADGVAPARVELGVMLPYTPLHHLLLADVGRPLVMTSGNRSGDPIAHRNAEALERLAAIADVFVLHDRPIEARTDDSVERVVRVDRERRPMSLRRSRGRVPTPIELPVAAPAPVLGCGGHLKNTFALAQGRRAWVGPHVGDLESWDTYRSFREGVERFQRLFDVEPGVVVHDLHPDYLSTRYAKGRPEPSLAVQHHFAHFAACLAEHGETGPAVGVIFDGTGYGPDGTVWGGEILVGDLVGFERVGHLLPVRLPGGDAAVREPWRMACAWLVACGDGTEDPPPVPATLRDRIASTRWDLVADLARRGVSSPLTTSAGRLFDAVAALCGLRAEVTHEGQAAIELEAAARGDGRSAAGRSYPIEARHAGAGLEIDPRPCIRAVQRDRADGVPVSRVAARFHEGLARATARAAAEAADDRGVDTVVLSGGVFQNVLLLERLATLLANRSLRPLVPRRLPPNDGGISFGQVAVAAARLASEGLRDERQEGPLPSR